ncbi:MAG: LysE family translocator [Rhodobacteraceae bacterium]|nr:LysE family translocator [Paracoccaceae bacterium]
MMLAVLPDFEALTIVAFLGASVLLYLTPGIDMLFTLASGAAGGRKVGLAAGLGVSLGSLFHTLVAVLGVAALIHSSALAYDLLRYVGAAYLLWLAVAALRAPPVALQGGGRRHMRSAFVKGALGNMLNPKVSIFILAFVPQFTDPAIGPVWMQIAVLGGLFSLCSIPFMAGFGLFAGVFAERISRGGRTMNRISALVFGGLAARLVFD